MSVSSNTPELPSPGAVPPTRTNPLVWWLAGGFGVLGVGALAAALVAGPKHEAAPEPVPAKAVAAKTAPKPAERPVAAVAVCATCGVVESVKSEKRKGEGTGLGAVGGAVVGGVVGHQVGGGNGKKAMTVLGAVGGGFAGNEIEKQARATTVYHVQLRMDDGSVRTVTQSTAPAVGARFEVEGNRLKPLPAKG